MNNKLNFIRSRTESRDKKSLIKNRTVMSCAREKTRVHFLQRLYCRKKIFVAFVFYVNVVVLNKLWEYLYFYISKSITLSTLFCLFLKSSKAFSATLTCALSFFKLCFSLTALRYYLIQLKNRLNYKIIMLTFLQKPTSNSLTERW